MTHDSTIDETELNRRVLVELIDIGDVDYECLVQVIQLMLLPEFERFFSALCRIDIGNAQPVGNALAHCAESLARERLPG